MIGPTLWEPGVHRGGSPAKRITTLDSGEHANVNVDDILVDLPPEYCRTCGLQDSRTGNDDWASRLKYTAP